MAAISQRADHVDAFDMSGERIARRTRADQTYAAAEALFTGTSAIVFRICEAMA